MQFINPSFCIFVFSNAQLPILCNQCHGSANSPLIKKLTRTVQSVNVRGRGLQTTTAPPRYFLDIRQFPFLSRGPGTGR